MSTLYSAALSPTAVTPSSEASGYDGDNVLTHSVARAWRSTTTAGTTTLIIDLGSSKAVVAIAVNHVNATSMAVKADNSATPSTARGTLTSYADKQGRRKGLLAFSATVRYLMLEFTGTPTDAAAYWFAGAVHVFSASAALARDPLYGSEVGIDYPQSVQVLPNGRRIRIDRGVSRATLRLRFSATGAQDAESLVRTVRAGAAWLDLGIANELWHQYPVQHLDDGVNRQMQSFNRELLAVPLLELA